MLNKLKQKWMSFRDIFKDSNDINEKTVVGFASFAIMTIFAIARSSYRILWKRFSN